MTTRTGTNNDSAVPCSGKTCVRLSEVDGFLFDLDGVVTNTSALHSSAWKLLFDDFLKKDAARQGIPFKPFDIDTEFKQYVDGKPRYEGVVSFLESRGIDLPWGEKDDHQEMETIYGLGNRKNRLFNELLGSRGAEVFETSLSLLKDLRSRGIKTAVVSSSKNCPSVMKSAGITELFDVRMSSIEAEEMELAGKPAPDVFLKAAEMLDVKPERAVVIEDAISGVQSGRAGGFRHVIGVAREGEEDDLRKNGADIVVSDLGELQLLD